MATTASPDDFERLAVNVCDELQAQNAMQQLGLSGKTLDQLAQAVAVNVTHAFEVRWAPNWVKEGQPHAWADDDGAFAECVPCRVVFGPAASEGEARHLYDEHRVTVHQHQDRSGA